jgi:hypothetical protein
MGGVPTKLDYAPAVAPYTSLEGEDARKLWNRFSKVYQPQKGVSAGFGLMRPNFAEILSVLKGSFDGKLPDVEACFQSFDTDQVRAIFMELSKLSLTFLDIPQNGLVDALEVFCTFAATSKMSSDEKLKCEYFILCCFFYLRTHCFWSCAVVFDCYDFDKTGTLSMAEMSLALEFTLIGVCKLCNDSTAPSGEDLDEFTAQVRNAHRNLRNAHRNLNAPLPTRPL